MQSRGEPSRPGSTRKVESRKRSGFPSGKAVTAGGKRSPCFACGCFLVGRVGCGRAVPGSPLIACASPGTSRSGQAGRQASLPPPPVLFRRCLRPADSLFALFSPQHYLHRPLLQARLIPRVKTEAGEVRTSLPRPAGTVEQGLRCAVGTTVSPAASFPAAAPFRGAKLPPSAGFPL